MGHRRKTAIEPTVRVSLSKSASGRTEAVNASPRILTLEGHQEVLEEAPTAGRRGPKGARIGDVVVAEGTRSRVAELDPARHKAICRLFEGSHARRRFRAQSIVKVEGGAGP